MTTTWFPRATALFLVLISGRTAVAQTPATLRVPDTMFVRPTGPYAVGMRETLWVDMSRGEPFTKDTSDRRHVMLRIWYPAQSVPGAVPAPYVLDTNEFGDAIPRALVQMGHHILTNAVLDAPAAKPKSGERFPVLLYEPGGGNARFSATFEAEQLASYGYVVVASDHAGFSDTRHFPDGYDFRPDTMLQPPPAATPQQSVEAIQAWLSRDVFPTWTADAEFVLDQLPRLNADPGVLHHRLDLKRIGMYGWSFGGATSVQMSEQDPRVKAVVDQDGQLFGDVVMHGTRRPVLLMHHGDKKAPPAVPGGDSLSKALTALIRGPDSSLFAHSTGDRFDLTIPRTQHGNFADGVLLVPRAPGDMDPRRAHAIIVAYTLAFFDRYLRGIDSPLLHGASAAYPDVEFRKGK